MKTKIVATIGPSSLKETTLSKMIQNGMGVARINSAYGDKKQYDMIVTNIRKVDTESRVKILFDIKSKQYLPYCKEIGVEMIAISFAETKEQILDVRKELPEVFIVSKIESVKGVQNYGEILKYSDGIMVARGDLSAAVSLEKIPPVQKKLTKQALLSNKFVIAATEMLLSMVSNPKPTNAEASDVANAVFDGVHAVMLSEETAIGKYPAEAVDYMKKIIFEAESWCDTNECWV